MYQIWGYSSTAERYNGIVEVRGSNPRISTKYMKTESEHTGRYTVVDNETGRKFVVEPIGNPRTNFGDINPSTGKLEGSYGQKYKGSIDAEDSIITEENGFTNIGYAQNPNDYIDKILKR